MKNTFYLRAIARLCYTPVCLLVMGGYSPTFGQTTYYVANTGNDANSGRSSDAPYQTINKINSLSLQPGDQVLFKRDDRFSGSLQIRQSGTLDKPIVIDAYGSGNKPVLTGAVGVSTWTNISNNTWQAVCSSCGSRVTGLYRDNTALPLGRYPNLDASNKGYLTVQSHTGKTQLTSQQALSGNWSGGEVVFRPVQWILNRATITGQSGNTLTVEGSGNYDISDNWGFFIQNHPATLDQTGEWCYNPANKTIQLYDSQSNPNTQKLSVTVFSEVISLTGVSYVTVRNIQITQALAANLSAINSSNLVITGNDLTVSGEDGLLIKGSGQQILMENNLIEDANNNGVDIGAYQNVTFRNNIIRRIGMIPGRGRSGDGTYVGFQAATTANTLIENNILDNIGYNALNFSTYTTVQRNQISNFCLTKSDGSGLYIWNGNQQPMANIRLLSNIVTNGIGAPEGSPAGSSSGANGIYLDDCTANIEVSGNSVSNCKGLGIYLHGSSNINLTGNISFNNNEAQLAIMSANGCQPRSNTIQNNIFVSRSASQFLVKYESNQNDLASYGQFNNNVYARPFDDGNKILTVYNKTIGASLSLTQWQAQYGKDMASSNSPMTYSSGNPDDIIKFLTNCTGNPTQMPVSGTYRDARNTKWTDQVTIPAYSSVVLLKDNTPVVTLRTPENPANVVAGLDYQYYEGSWSTMPDFNAVQTTKTGTVSSPDLSVRNRTENYGIRFKGYINVPTDGVYTFYTSSDDGSKLLIGTTEVVNNDGVHAAVEKSGTIGLKAGKHAITVLYFQGGGGQTLTLNYEGPGIGKQAIPASGLYRLPAGTGLGSGSGLMGTYFNNPNLTAPAVLTRTDAPINFDWGTGSPASGINSDNFSIRWTGQVEAPVSGNYTFSTTSDDGVRLWVNGTQVINNWSLHASATDNSPVIMLTAGQRYTIQMEYYDGGGGAVAKLLWAYPGQNQQLVPQSYLYPAAASTASSAPAIAPSGNAIYLSDLTWTSASNGYGPVEKDRSNGESNAGDGKTITLNGVTYAKGLGVHGPATITYNLNGQYTRFLTDVGLDDEVSTCGTVSFDVYLDNVLAYSSGVMNPTSATKAIDLNVSGKQTLKLVVTNGGDDASCDHGDWAGARLIGASGARVAAADTREFSEESLLKAYPVPAKDIVWVRYYASTAGEATVQLINMMAQPVHQATHQLTEGENLIKVMVDQYNRGSYILSVTQNQQRQTRKVLLVE